MALLAKLSDAVNALVTARTEGPFLGDVEALCTGPEAEKARKARAAATAPWPVGEDAECRLADQTVAVIAAALAQAQTHRAPLEPPPGGTSLDPTLPAARQLVLDLEAALRRATAWSQDAAASTTRWVHRLRRAELQRLDEQLATPLATAAALATHRAAYAAETTRLAGQPDPEDPGHPFPLLLGHGAEIARVARWWTPPPPAPPPPLPAGFARVLVVTEFQDSVERWRHQRGCVVTLPEKDADEVVRKGWATEVVEA